MKEKETISLMDEAASPSFITRRKYLYRIKVFSRGLRIVALGLIWLQLLASLLRLLVKLLGMNIVCETCIYAALLKEGIVTEQLYIG